MLKTLRHAFSTLSPLTVWAVTTGILCAFAIAFATWHLTYQRSLHDLERETVAAAQLRVTALQSELEKQRASPAILGDDADVKAALAAPTPERLRAISQKLENLRQETRSSVIYVLDAKGIAIAASNWRLPESFVGSDYSFRRYFSQALSKGEASQFALGTVSHQPGLYLAHRVVANTKTVGVVVVKVEFDEIEAAWGRSGDLTFVTDSENKVVLSAGHPPRFAPPPPAAAGQVHQALPVPGTDWQLQVRRSDTPARTTAISATAITVLIETLLGIALIWAWRRRQFQARQAQADLAYRQTLEQDVAARTEDLSRANARLSQEIIERQNTQNHLNALQADLVQANKLAQLGQITAGVAHEVNQPLATIRILAENALNTSPSPKTMVRSNLETIIRMSDRIGHITGELRAFSRKGSGEAEPTSVADAVDGSILLTQSRLKAHAVGFQVATIDPALQVWGQRVRLEQVLVNLLQNAFEAVEATPSPQVRLDVEAKADTVRVIITDNGPGLPETVKAALFIPFTTTKPKGLGLGLVIAHDIVQDFGGSLSIDPDYSDGARFIISLRRATA